MKNLSSNPAVNVLKNIGSSGLFLGAAVCYTVAAVLSFISAVTPNANAAQLLQSLYELTDMDPSVYAAMASATSSSAVGAVIGMIPTILIAVALWLTYVSCRSAQTGGVSTAGMTICKVISIIGIVGICIGIVCLLAFGVVLLAAGGMAFSEVGYGYEEAAVAASAIAVLMLVLAALLVVVLLYEIFIVKTINRIKATALTGTPDDRVSQFVIVMSWISGVCAIISGLGMLFTSPLSGLSGLASAVCAILIAVCLSQYKKQMRMVMYPPVQPVYAQPYQEPAPQQPYQAPVQPQAAPQPQEDPQTQIPQEPSDPNGQTPQQ